MSDSLPDTSENFRFFGLGGCNEVGRSCHIIEYKNKVVMLDAGVHPGLLGLGSLPFYDEYDLSKVDILLISHFHLDHAASLPYVMQHTNFQGRVFMTHATKAIYRWLLSDFVRVTSITGGGDEGRQNGGNRDGGTASANLYTDDDLMRSFDRIETVDFHLTMEIDGIRFTAYHAGHVLGACMYFVEIGGLKTLFTGDYSREEDRHLKVAEVPPVRPDILITESTFGTASHEPRLEKEARMMNIIHLTVLKGGRVLMPVFALGRAQELLLILEEYWLQNKDVQHINVYFASNLARKCMAVYQTYTSIMSDSIRLSAMLLEDRNPFQFKHILSIKNLEKIHDMGPCVVVASPGMLQSGVSRQLLERWAPDPKNSVIMTGYSVEGTMAKDLLNEPHAFPSIANPEVTIPRRMSIDEISFAAHVDFQQNAGFIEKVNPLKIILVHGDGNPMGRLKSALMSRYASRKGTELEVKVFNPRNCDELLIGIKGSKAAKVMGSLAEEQIHMLKQQIQEKIEREEAELEELPEVEEVEEKEEEKKEEVKEQKDEKEENGVKEEEKKENGVTASTDLVASTEEPAKDTGHTFNTGQALSGVLISKDFDLNLLQLQDLHEFTQLSTSIVKSKINLKVLADISLVRWHLEQMFGYIEIVNDDEDEWECAIMDMIDVMIDRTKLQTSLHVTVEWINDNLMADSLADSVVAILYSIDSSPASVKLSSKSCNHVKKENGDVEMAEADSDAKKPAHANSEISSRIQRISKLLRAQFGDSLQVLDGNRAVITIGKNHAKIDYSQLTVECGSKVLRDRVENIIKRGSGLAAPLSQHQKA